MNLYAKLITEHRLFLRGQNSFMGKPNFDLYYDSFRPKINL